VTTVAAALQGFLDWREPRDGIGDNPFRLACRLEPPASVAEIRAAWPERELPDELSELWLTCRRAWLFEDTEYQQWGLMLLPPDVSARRTACGRRRRPEDVKSNDIVIGEFLGDQELLLLAPSEEPARRVLVALPLDRRDDWYPAGGGLAEFLDQYLIHFGEKYWERRESN
jgi:hypothetical protein